MNLLAWGLVGLVFLLACSGALVAVYGAGMAVPDWPATFGHWLYPPHRWLGRLDGVFFNQSHRALAQLTVVWAAVLAVLVWRSDSSRPIRILSLAVVLGIIAQGSVGGWRVLSNRMAVAAIHAVISPAVFGLCVALAVGTSRRWLAAEPMRGHRDAKALHRWCLAALLLAYLPIVANAQIQHMPPTAGLSWLPFWVWTMLAITMLAVAAAGRLLLLAARRFGGCPAIVRRIEWFAGLLALQLLLSGGAWVTRYGWPPWFADYVLPIPYTIADGGPLQRVVVAFHIVAGLLAVAAGVNATLWTYKVLPEARQ